MQNKPNLPNAQINVSTAITKEYKSVRLCRSAENKPNSNPIQTQFKANSKPIQSQFKANQTQSNPTCSELARTEQGRSVEPISNQHRKAIPQFLLLPFYFLLASIFPQNSQIFKKSLFFYF